MGDSLKTHSKRPKAPWCWQEKNNLRAIRALAKQKLIKRSEGRNMLDVFRALTELISDSAGNEVIAGTNLTKRIGGYALMCPDTVKKTLNLMADHELIRISKMRDFETGRYQSTEIELLAPPQRRPAQALKSLNRPETTPGQLLGGSEQTLIEKNFQFEEESFELQKSEQVFGEEKVIASREPADERVIAEPFGNLDDFEQIATSKDELLTKKFQEALAYLNRATRQQFSPQRDAARHLRERLQEGASVEELILVIDHRTALWWKNPVMKPYLRPSTLFSREKFWEYLELARTWNAEGRPKIEPRAERPDVAALTPEGHVREEMLSEWKERTQS